MLFPIKDISIKVRLALHYLIDMGLARARENLIALYIGVLLLAVLWQVVFAVAKDIPRARAMYQVGIAIAIAAGAALLILAKSGIGK